jgi:glycyl-tRNA synthetase alpha chain
VQKKTFFFQDIILALQNFWMSQGAILLQPYDLEVGAGTSHPATSLRTLEANPWKVVYVQPSRRPSDGRYGDNPNRLQHYYQLQVIMKPGPENIQELCLESLAILGLTRNKNDIRFLEDNWENPTLGAWGLGWEIWCNGMEVLQFTYMQQLGGIEIKPVPVEITYGLERLALYVQGVESVWDIAWNETTSYRDVFLKSEKEFCRYNFELADLASLQALFKIYLKEGERLVALNCPMPAYDQGLKASHIFNLLEARGAFSVTERASYMSDVRNLIRDCCKAWYESNG